ncbi:hypothetical protein BKA66DRAFT_464152 [Pyrenochaeta sp. MPI-SDFR-AT-0127]|nr:hypothetical protein BKA66DRAFT_464152 [Pyrenochaeta sp. MPI-SDFR-AT-0127]
MSTSKHSLQGGTMRGSINLPAWRLYPTLPNSLHVIRGRTYCMRGCLATSRGVDQRGDLVRNWASQE